MHGRLGHRLVKLLHRAVGALLRLAASGLAAGGLAAGGLTAGGLTAGGLAAGGLFVCRCHVVAVQFLIPGFDCLH